MFLIRTSQQHANDSLPLLVSLATRESDESGESHFPLLGAALLLTRLGPLASDTLDGADRISPEVPVLRKDGSDSCDVAPSKAQQLKV